MTTRDDLAGLARRLQRLSACGELPELSPLTLTRAQHIVARLAGHRDWREVTRVRGDRPPVRAAGPHRLLAPPHHTLAGTAPGSAQPVWVPITPGGDVLIEHAPPQDAGHHACAWALSEALAGRHAVVVLSPALLAGTPLTWLRIAAADADVPLRIVDADGLPTTTPWLGEPNEDLPPVSAMFALLHPDTETAAVQLTALMAEREDDMVLSAAALALQGAHAHTDRIHDGPAALQRGLENGGAWLTNTPLAHGIYALQGPARAGAARGAARLIADVTDERGLPSGTWTDDAPGITVVCGLWGTVPAPWEVPRPARRRVIARLIAGLLARRGATPLSLASAEDRAAPDLVTPLRWPRHPSARQLRIAVGHRPWTPASVISRPETPGERVVLRGGAAPVAADLITGDPR